MSKANNVRTSASGAGVVAVGAAISLLVSILTAAICAALIASETIGASSAGYCAMIILLTGAFAGSITAGKGRERRVIFIALTGACYMLLLLALTALFFDGRFQGIGVSALVILSGCILGLFLTQTRQKRTKPRGSKIRRR